MQRLRFSYYATQKLLPRADLKKVIRVRKLANYSIAKNSIMESYVLIIIIIVSLLILVCCAICLLEGCRYACGKLIVQNSSDEDAENKTVREKSKTEPISVAKTNKPHDPQQSAIYMNVKSKSGSVYSGGGSVVSGTFSSEKTHSNSEVMPSVVQSDKKSHAPKVVDEHFEGVNKSMNDKKRMMTIPVHKVNSHEPQKSSISEKSKDASTYSETGSTISGSSSDNSDKLALAPSPDNSHFKSEIIPRVIHSDKKLYSSKLHDDEIDNFDGKDGKKRIASSSVQKGSSLSEPQSTITSDVKSKSASANETESSNSPSYSAHSEKLAFPKSSSGSS